MISGSCLLFLISNREVSSTNMCIWTEEGTVWMRRVHILYCSHSFLGVLRVFNPPTLCLHCERKSSKEGKRSQSSESNLYTSTWTISSQFLSALQRTSVVRALFALKPQCAFTPASSVCAVCGKAAMLHLLLLTMHLEFPPKQFDGACSEAAVLKAAVDNSWTPSEWLHDSSFHWNHTFHVNWLSLSLSACTHVQKNTHTHTHSPRSLKAARPGSSVPPCSPAAGMDGLFDCFRVSERNFFDDCGHLFDPHVSSLDVLAVATTTYHSSGDISSRKQTPFCSARTYKHNPAKAESRPVMGSMWVWLWM